MHLHFCTANHSVQGRDALVDMFLWLRPSLEKLGHKVTISDRGMDPSAMNVLWELFTADDVHVLRSSGARYGLIATEYPDGGGFNTRRDGGWPERWEAFLQAAEGASFIWATMERAAVPYARLAPAAYLEFGFIEELARAPAKEEPVSDFVFLGSRTDYRVELIERLRRHARVTWPGTLVAAPAYERLLASAKVGLVLKQSPEWPTPAATRVGRIILARRGLAAEFMEDMPRHATIVPPAPKDADFVDFALAKLPSWRRDADEAIERFRVEMPMERIMEQVLDQTLGASRV